MFTSLFERPMLNVDASPQRKKKDPELNGNHDQRVVQCGDGIGPSTGRNNCQVFSFNGFNMVSYSFVTEIFGICWNWWHQDHQVTSSEDITRSWNSLRPFGHTDEHNHPAQIYREPSKRGRFGTRIDTKLLKGGNVAMSCDVQNSRGCSGECYDVLCLRMGQISMSGVKVYSRRVGHILPIALTNPHVESCHCEARNLVQESFNEFLTQWIKYIVFWCSETLWPYVFSVLLRFQHRNL